MKLQVVIAVNHEGTAVISLRDDRQTKNADKAAYCE